MYNSHINIQIDDLLSDVKSQIIIIIIIIIGHAKLDLLTRLYLPIKFQNHWTNESFSFYLFFPCVCGMNNLLDVVNKQTNKKFFIAMEKQMDPVKSNGKKEKNFLFPIIIIKLC